MYAMQREPSLNYSQIIISASANLLESPGGREKSDWECNYYCDSEGNFLWVHVVRQRV
jgi:hypothetical protein